jgi:glutamine cyclotransferase
MGEHPHDPKAFTQGLEYDEICDGGAGAPCRQVLWESTGLTGRSSVREVELTTGDSYFMQFCWTHDAPDADGNLPIANMSCTQVPFKIGDTEVFYDGN